MSEKKNLGGDAWKLAAKMAEVMAEVGPVARDSVGTDGRREFNYTSADAVLSKVQRALSARGIAVSSYIELLSQEKTKNGATLVTLKVRLTFTDGSTHITAEGVGSGQDYGDKAAMKALTAAHKYAYALALCISWGDDPEKPEETPEKPKRTRAPKDATSADSKKDAPAEEKPKRGRRKKKAEEKISLEEGLAKAEELGVPTADEIAAAAGDADKLEEYKKKIVGAREALGQELYRSLGDAWKAASTAKEGE